ncbi:MAG: transcription-repair coupling factor [Actinobacteria bacterium]|nr:transcription-repair coupling factor [Actinomycetota bacterium]MCA1721719.1 transcription-repair coupling factor [Actinomycetota bacterium]
MPLEGLLDVVSGDPALARALQTPTAPTLDLTAPAGLRPFVVASLVKHGRTVLAVTATGREAEDLVDALGSLVDGARVALFPSWETLPHERLSPRADTVGRRLAVLRRLAHPSDDDPATGPLDVVVAPVRSILQPQVPGLGDLEPVQLQQGQDVQLDEVVQRLVDISYARVELVEKRGEFAVRGGILDVFPPTEEHPVRVELWGDTVEEVRFFKVADQRSLALPQASSEGQLAGHGLWAPPCRELLLTPQVRERARALAQLHPELHDILDKIADGTPVEGMEALAPVLVDELRLLIDELPAGTSVVVCDPEKVRTRAHDLVRTSQEFLEASWSTAAVGGVAPIDLGAAAYRSLVDVRDHAATIGLPWWSVTPFTADEDLEDETVVLAAAQPPAYRGDTEVAVKDVRSWIEDGWRVVITAPGHGSADRLVEVLRADGLPVKTEGAVEPGTALVTTGCLDTGFESALLKTVVLTEGDLTGSRGIGSKDVSKRMPSRRRNAVDPLQLRPGDLVVHEQHGVGRYVEMVQRTVQGATREYLILEYAKGDKLFVPTDQLEQVTRYVGGEAPTLDRLGGSDWAKRKGRAKKAVREIAAGLIQLYSARMASPGHAFGADTPWQRELEDAFPYVETPDQLDAINEVKGDMEKGVPMDRVICGDVGYGKTEIAVRAAFKAVQDGKQVAVLVPTTLLVQQHYGTFRDRFAQFPVTVRAVSRFNSDKEQKDVMADVKEGRVDVVIGTHRLLSKDTTFKDLGLVIVDEEQRFGVEHKEFLKQMRTAVDVLTMSATPIPRTLEMSLTGIREMSTILTPPEERHPVLTFVGPYDEKQISAAIRRELLREGQVFYLHNRVESIDRTAKKLAELVPEARIAVGHGQMNEAALEQVMVGFWEKSFDVLVCTTIVESGLDIPNANTLIVERADAFGLSQLHQIRGRVGRGRERAYAYFTYPPEKPLTETAYDRLATIAQNTEIGAGMAVAMKDLEIRGAGNLLGGEQSGHIASVGFDLYMRLVGEAVSDFKKGGSLQDEPEPIETKVDLPIDAHLPHQYVPGERLRLEAYRRLAAAGDDGAIEAVRAELVDRYGPVPTPVENLLAVASFRAHAKSYGITEVTLQGNAIRFAPMKLRESQVMRLQRLFPGTIVKLTVETALVPRPKTARIGGTPIRDVELLNWARALLDAVLGESVAAAAAT